MALHIVERMDRYDVTFPSGNDQCAAWLYRPKDCADPAPARPIVVIAHGLAGVKEERLDAFAERFAAAGYFCLVFDYRHFGASTGYPRQLLSIKRQRQDWRAAVVFARAVPGVDLNRVILWGTSFSGGHVLVTAAEDPRIAAVIAQCPFTDGLASTAAIATPTSLRVTTRAIQDVLALQLNRPPVMIPSYGPPGSTALMTAPDVVVGVERLMPPGASYRKDVTARIAFEIIGDSPGRHVSSISCPIFFAICEHDSVAPANATQRHAAKARRGEIKLYDVGHFDPYVGPTFERIVTDQLSFLTRHVPVE